MGEEGKKVKAFLEKKMEIPCDPEVHEELFDEGNNKSLSKILIQKTKAKILVVDEDEEDPKTELSPEEDLQKLITNPTVDLRTIDNIQTLELGVFMKALEDNEIDAQDFDSLDISKYVEKEYENDDYKDLLEKQNV